MPAIDLETVTVLASDVKTVRLACLRYLPDDAPHDVVAALSRLDSSVYEDGTEPEPEPEPLPDGAGGRWACIAFMCRNEYTGYVRDITKGGQAAYRVDLPGLVYGGNPLDYVEYAATAWFSEWPVTEASVRAAWEAKLRAAGKRRRQEAEWARMQEQRALTAGDDDLDDDYDRDFEGPVL